MRVSPAAGLRHPAGLGSQPPLLLAPGGVSPQGHSPTPVLGADPSSHPHPRSGWLGHGPSHGPGSLFSSHHLLQRVSCTRRQVSWTAPGATVSTAAGQGYPMPTPSLREPTLPVLPPGETRLTSRPLH